MQTAAGTKIRTVRIDRGWTQADLSHFSRMSTGDISRIESGRLIPTGSQLKRLADALEIPRQELLENHQEPVAS